jgi:hypothetical protein
MLSLLSRRVQYKCATKQLRLEVLEDRTVPATYMWNFPGPGEGQWQSLTNWLKLNEATGQFETQPVQIALVPGAGDRAEFNATYSYKDVWVGVSKVKELVVHDNYSGHIKLNAADPSPSGPTDVALEVTDYLRLGNNVTVTNPGDPNVLNYVIGALRVTGPAATFSAGTATLDRTNLYLGSSTNPGVTGSISPTAGSAKFSLFRSSLDNYGALTWYSGDISTYVGDIHNHSSGSFEVLSSGTRHMDTWSRDDEDPDFINEGGFWTVDSTPTLQGLFVNSGEANLIGDTTTFGEYRQTSGATKPRTLH